MSSAIDFHKLIAEQSNDFISVYDFAGRYLFCSPSIRAFGYDPSDLIGKQIFSFAHPEDKRDVSIHHGSHAGGPVEPIRYRFLAKDGYRWVETVSKAVSSHDCLVAVTRDIEQRKLEEDRILDLASRLDEANRQLEQLVITDSLTCINNRRHFMDRLEHMIAEAERGRPLSCLIIDVDNFKQFNDSYGHTAGDEALKQIAEAMKGVVRKTDCLARYGGEEFVISLANDLIGSMTLANKLLAVVADIKNEHRTLSISIGVAEYAPGDTAKRIISRADTALYRAKQMGRNRAISYDISQLRIAV